MKKCMLLDLLLCGGFANLFLFEAMFRRPKTAWGKDHYDCILVCGYPANPDGTISAVTKSRTEKGIELYKEGKADKLLFSGGAVKNEFVEAKVMAQYAVSQGVPEEDILLEEKAGSTYANLKNSLSIIKQNQIKTLIVVTNDWHLRKADHYTRKLKKEYVMVAADRPEGESFLKNLYLHLQTNLITYYNLWQGLY